MRSTFTNERAERNSAYVTRISAVKRVNPERSSADEMPLAVSVAIPRRREHLLRRAIERVADVTADDQQEPDVGHHEQEHAEPERGREHGPARFGVAAERVECDRNRRRRLAFLFDDLPGLRGPGAQTLPTGARLGGGRRVRVAGVVEFIGHGSILAQPKRARRPKCDDDPKRRSQQEGSMDQPTDYDVVIVGAGFAGMYMLHRARGLGLSARVFEAGERRRRHVVLEPLSRRALRRREHGVLVPVLRGAPAGVGVDRALRDASPRS